MTSAKRGPLVLTKAAALARHVAGRRAPTRRSVLVGPELETPTRDPLREHVAGGHAPAGRRAGGAGVEGADLGSDPGPV